jgi:hypothetical protein
MAGKNLIKRSDIGSFLNAHHFSYSSQLGFNSSGSSITRKALLRSFRLSILFLRLLCSALRDPAAKFLVKAVVVAEAGNRSTIVRDAVILVIIKLAIRNIVTGFSSVT